MKYDPNKNSILLAVSLAVFTDAFLYCLALPLLPAYSKQYRLNQIDLDILIGSYAVALLLGTYPLGRLVDKIGRRAVLLWGLLSLFSTTFIFAFATSYLLLVLARILQGLSATITWTAGMAFIADYFNKDARGRAMGIAVAFANLGVLIGLPVSGWLYQHYSPRAPFFAAAILVLVDALSRTMLLRDKASNSTLNIKIGLRELIKNIDILVFSGSIVIGSGLLALLDATLPTYLDSTIKMTTTTIGLYLSVAAATNMVVSVFIGAIAVKFGRKSVLTFGLLLTAICVPLPIFAKSTIGIASYMALIGVANTLVLSSANPAVADIVESMNSNSYGSVFSISNISHAIGIMAGPILGSTMLHTMGIKGTLALTWIILILYILAVNKAATATSLT